MFVFTAAEMARITQATFLDRLDRFLFQRARSGSARAVLADRAVRATGGPRLAQARC